MAGSGLPPLPNIPYCCLPQESGPCLSASVGDRPLRSPTHRRLGGPSPRRLSNGTHARPVPPEGFAGQGMPLNRRMADYPAFPPATRRNGVGCIRVTHPSSTLTGPEGPDPVRLACIRPAASVHPEPGSNSSLYYCLCLLFSLNLGFRLDVLFGVPSTGSLPRAAPAALVLCWPQTFKDLFASAPLPLSSFLPKAGAKVLPFSELASSFFNFFQNYSYVIEY